MKAWDIENISFNFKDLKILDVNINQILCLIKIYLSSKKVYFDYDLSKGHISDLIEKEYLISNKSGFYLRDKGEKVIKLFVSIKVDKSKDEELDSYTSQYRSLFKDIRVGSMGNAKAVKKKLQRFIDTNTDVTFDDIINASKLYIDSFNGNFKYIKRADYFIYKQNYKGEETSELEIWIEQVKKEPENSDWRTELK